MEQPQELDRTARGKASGVAQQSGPGGQGPVWGRISGALGIFIFGVGAGAAVLHFCVERPALETARARTLQYEHELAVVRGQLDEAMNTMAAFEGRLAVEESTRRGLEKSLRTMQSELGQAQDTIAFYEQLMPPGPKGAVSVRALDIERAGPNLKYRVLLMRSGSNGEPFEGSLQFVASGRLNGEEASLSLEPARLPGVLDPIPANVEDDARLEAFPLSFDQFQRSGGLLNLPEGFEPESVTVNVMEGKVLRVSRSVDIPGQE